MVKSYLKFEHSKTFGDICSASANVIWDSWNESTTRPTKTNTGRAFVGANEEVLIWDLKKGQLLGRWKVEDNTARVSIICRSDADPDVFAVGYEDGKIRIWDSQTATVIITFNGHKSAVTQIKFDHTGARLASGGKDTDIIVWDLVGEVGLFRLRGHKDLITSLNFISSTSKQDVSVSANPEESAGFLLTTSKDALIKVWDLSTQHCIETHVAQSNGECWSLGLFPEMDGCITAGNDGELKAWTLNRNVLGQTEMEGKLSQVLVERGVFYRQGKDRTIAIRFHPTQDLIAVHGAEKSIELWRMKTEEEVRKAINRKRKRKREKENHDIEIEDQTFEEQDTAVSVSDMFALHMIVRTGGKVGSIDWAGGHAGQPTSILVATTNNQLEVFELLQTTSTTRREEKPDYNRIALVDMPGHRTDIRCLALSSDDRMLASASHGCLKIWNVRTQTCLRTLDCGYALCATFLPGDKIVVIGTREGTLEIFDVASAVLLDTINAHDRDVWSIHVKPDGKSIISGSADKTAKFWDLEVVQEVVLGSNRKVAKLRLIHKQTLKTNDDILAVRFSPDSRLLAVSTLDSTVKIFFVDSLKLFLTLYGHKLPVLSMDISFDSKLIVTSSADKNVRVWGLDFGDCHKAFFAHQDSILSVSFVPNNNDGNGHHFLSASKDRIVKYYDADKFEQIQRLPGHHGEIWTMIIATSGQFFVTASHDKSIRIWQQTDEQIFLEEEREKELEDLYEDTLVTSLGQDNENEDESIAVGKQTTQTLMGGEKIAEALDIGLEDVELMRQYHQAILSNPKTGYPQRNAIFLANNNISASQYVQNVFSKIPATSLQDAMLVLSFSHLPALFTFMSLWASEGRNIPLTCRILFFMIKTHQKQIVSSKFMKSMLEDTKSQLRKALSQQKHELGFNLAGLRVTGRRLHELDEADYIVEDQIQTNLGADKERNKKRVFANIA